MILNYCTLKEYFFGPKLFLLKNPPMKIKFSLKGFSLFKPINKHFIKITFLKILYFPLVSIFFETKYVPRLEVGIPT